MKQRMQKVLALAMVAALCAGMLSGAAVADPDPYKCLFFGWVTDASMRPVRGVRVTLETPDPDRIPIEDVFVDTDEHGYWELLLDKGTYRFLFRHADYLEEAREWKYDGEIDDLVECEPVMLTRRPQPPAPAPEPESIIGVPEDTPPVNPMDILNTPSTDPEETGSGQEGAPSEGETLPGPEASTGEEISSVGETPTEGTAPTEEVPGTSDGGPAEDTLQPQDPSLTETPVQPTDAPMDPSSILQLPVETKQPAEEPLPDGLPEETQPEDETPLPDETQPDGDEMMSPEAPQPAGETEQADETEPSQESQTPLPAPFGFIPSGDETETTQPEPSPEVQGPPLPDPTEDPAANVPGTDTPDTDTSGTEETGTAPVEDPPSGQTGAALERPALSRTDAIMTGEDTVLAWEPVEGATGYLLTLTSTTDMAQEPIIEGMHTEETAAVLPAEALAAGQSYMAAVTAVAQGEQGESLQSEPAYWTFAYQAAEPAADPDAQTDTELPQAPTTILSGVDALTYAAGPPVITDIGKVLPKGQIDFAWSAVAGATQYTFTTAKGPALVTNRVSTGANTAYRASVPSIGHYEVTVDAYSGSTHLGTSEPYAFDVIDPAYTNHSIWAIQDGVVVYPNDNDATPTGVVLPRNTEALAVGRTQTGTFYQVLLGTGAYGFVRTAEFATAAPMSAPLAPTITYTEDDPYMTLTVTPTDPRPAVYLVSVYTGTPETLVYIDTATTMPYRMRLTLYDTPCRVEVIAQAADATQNIPNSLPVSTTFTRPSPTNAAQAPFFTGDVAAGFLLYGTSAAEWNAVAGAGSYEWKVLGDDGQVKAGGTVTGSTVPAASLAALVPGTQYVFAVRTLVPSLNPSQWAVSLVQVVAPATPFITGFTMSANQVAPGSTVTFQLLGQTLPSATKVVITYGATTMEYDVNITASKTVSLRFDQLGLYSIHFSNGATLPPTLAQTLVVANDPITLTIKEIGVKEKDKTFTIEWTAVSGTAFSLLMWHMDGTLQFPAGSITTNSYAVPAANVPKIGPYSVTVTAETSEPKPTATATFEVIDGAFKALTGKVKDAATPMYLYAGNKVLVTQLAKDQSVTVIGELDGYYHIRLGSGTTTTTGTSTTTETTTYGFVLKDALTVSSSSSGSSGGGGGGGGGGGRVSTTVNTAAFKAAFETETARKTSYAYIPGLYVPLMEMMADPESDVVPRSLQELLTLSFASLPDELNSEQYNQARERAAWNQVTAYLIMLVTEAATDEIAQREDAMQALALYVSELIDEQLLLALPMDDAVKKVLEEIGGQAKVVAESKTAGALQGTNQEIAISALERILNTLPYDGVLLEEIPKAFDTTLHADILPDEPLEVRFLRVLYALSDYEQTRFALALEALGDAANAADINVVYDAYLDYVYAVARMHNLSFTMGKAPANEVVQSWGTETNRLINVNKVYSTFAQ